MTRKMMTFALVVGLLLWGAPALAADSSGKMSGRLVDVRPDGKLVIEEQGPWKGPGTGLVMRTVDLTPETSIRVLRPTGQWDAGSPEPGYEIQPADFRALKPGDFVTVATGGGAMAVAIDVMRADDAGLASPPTESGR
jgi:hypothetical protein